MAKNFKTDSSATNIFVSSVNQQAPEGYKPPEGYRLVPESKTSRLHVLITPRLKAELLQLSKEKGMSLNALINKVLFDYAQGERKK